MTQMGKTKFKGADSAAVRADYAEYAEIRSELGTCDGGCNGLQQ